MSTSKQSHTWELCAKGRPREVASVAFCTFCGFNLLFYFSTEESRSNTFVLGNVVIVLTAANCFARKSKNCLIQGSNQVHPQMPVPFSGKGQEMFGIFCNVYQSSQSCSISQHDPTLLQDVTLKCCVRLSCLVHFYFEYLFKWTYFRCIACGRLLTAESQGKLRCVPNRMMVNHRGRVSYVHSR